MIKIGINGFGRIGRTIARINALNERYQLVKINDINPDIWNMAYLFKYDSTYDNFPGKVKVEDNHIVIREEKVSFSSQKEIGEVDWADKGVDVIIDSSGVGENIPKAKQLIRHGRIKKVIVTHSSDMVDKEIILGVNEDSLTEEDSVVSSSICDANAIAHILNWIDGQYGIETGSVTTLHPWLSYQNLVDAPAVNHKNSSVVWKDYALGRSSINALIPKNTTAVTCVEKVIPHLRNRIISFSYRTPTNIVTSSVIVLKPKICPTFEELKQYIEKKTRESKYVRVNYESLVSVDYKKEYSSAVVDMQWLKVENGLIKIILWYDNEWGYSCRVLDLVQELFKKSSRNSTVVNFTQGIPFISDVKR